MSWWHRRCRREERETELDAELQYHFDRQVMDYIEQGCSAAEARRRARLEFGGLEQVKEACREVRRAGWLEDFVRDVRLAARLLVREHHFSVFVIAVLALGIGVNAAILNAADAVLRRPLPYRGADRLVHLFETRTDGSRHPFSYPEYVEWRGNAGPLEQLAAYNGGSVTLVSGGLPERLTVAEVTDDFFDLLGVEARLGRTFRRGELGAGGAGLAVLSDGLWRRRFGGDPAIVGRTLELSEKSVVVIGVLRADFQFPLRPGVEMWVPLVPSAGQANRRDWHWLDLIGRLGPAVGPRQAEAALTPARSLDGEASWHRRSGVLVVPMRAEMVRAVRPSLRLLIGAAVLLLIAACANVGGLLAMRASRRRREFAVRIAIGAGRVRLLRQVLAETLLLATVSGALGLMLGWWALELLRSVMPMDRQASLPHVEQLTLGPTMTLLAVGLSFVTGLLVALGPARTAASTSPIGSMRGHAGINPSRLGRHHLLVAAEVAMVAVLLIGTGLLAKSVLRLQEVSPGFAVDHLLTFRVALPGEAYAEGPARVAFYRQLRARLSGLPGVSGAALINQLPLEGRGNTGSFALLGRDTRAALEVTANLRAISSNYFEVMGIALHEGRFFTDRDVMVAEPVVLVNQAFARRYGRGQGALGAQLEVPFANRRVWRIVGIVGDERFAELDQPATPVVYFPIAQDPRAQVTFVVRTAVDAAVSVAAIRDEVSGLDSALPIYAVRSMEAIVAALPSVFVRRYVLFLVATFAVLALGLSGIGVYSMLARSVVDRAHEIGVRVALGATGRDVAALVAGGMASAAAAGLTVGLVVALAVSRYLDHLLFEVPVLDPSTFGLAMAVIASLVVTACWLPTRRAASLDPSVTLRQD